MASGVYDGTKQVQWIRKEMAGMREHWAGAGVVGAAVLAGRVAGGTFIATRFTYDSILVMRPGGRWRDIEFNYFFI